MKQFDIISDLNLTEGDDFNWDGKATSLGCIVAGNIASDRYILFSALEELTKHYAKVFFIDGALEHVGFSGNFIQSYADLERGIDEIENVYFLHESIVILNGATLIATNGWTTFDFTQPGTADDNIEFIDLRGISTEATSYAIRQMAVFDSQYLENSIKTCQAIEDCNNIIMITSTIPDVNLIMHDYNYHHTILGDTAGNINIQDCFRSDTKRKINKWVFGTYAGDIDIKVENIQYISNTYNGSDLKMYHPKILKY